MNNNIELGVRCGADGVLTRRAAANLQELVNFYNQRFQMKLTEEQKQDLIAFLNSL